MNACLKGPECSRLRVTFTYPTFLSGLNFKLSILLTVKVDWAMGLGLEAKRALPFRELTFIKVIWPLVMGLPASPIHRQDGKAGRENRSPAGPTWGTWILKDE